MLKYGFQQKILEISNGKLDTVQSEFGLINFKGDTTVECWLCNSMSDVQIERISLPLKKIDTSALSSFFNVLGFTKTLDSSKRGDYLLSSADGKIKYHVLNYKTHISFIRDFDCPKRDRRINYNPN